MTLPSETAAAAASENTTAPAAKTQTKRRRVEPIPDTLRPTKNRELVRPRMLYPTSRPNARSAGAVHKSLKAQNVWEDDLKSQNRDMPSWVETLRKLESRTPKRTTAWKRHALKIVIPADAVKRLTTNLDDNIWDIHDRTTCEIDLYPGTEPHGWSALLLSGDDVVVQDAANLIMRACEDARISRPNPSSPDAPLLQKSAHAAKEPCISSKITHRPRHLSPGLRKSSRIYNDRFEDITKPAKWDQHSFMAYIRTVTLAELRPHRAIELYGSTQAADDVLMDLIYNAFEDETAADALTASAFRVALRRMAEGSTSSRNHVQRLFTAAQARRLPMDTATFNRLLLGPMQARNLVYFNQVLALMANSGCAPNYETWRLFLRMVHDEKAKREIVLAMGRIGLLQNPHATSDVVREIVGFDTHRAIRSGKDVGKLCREMDETYGPSWPSVTALGRMLDVCCRFHQFGMCYELLDRFEHVYQRRPDDRTLSMLLTGVELTNNFPAAFHILRRAEGWPWLKRTSDLYSKIFTVAWRWRLANVIAVVWTYACLEDLTSFTMRFRVAQHLAHPGYKMRPGFRTAIRKDVYRYSSMPGYVPVALQSGLDKELKANPRQVRSQGAVIARLFRDQLGGYVPSAPLSEMMSKAWELDKQLLKQRGSVSEEPGSHILSTRELIEEENLEVPVRHVKGSKEDAVVKVPITTAAVLHNFEKEWYGDLERHPLIVFRPWTCRLNDERDRPKDAEGEQPAEGQAAEEEGRETRQGKPRGEGDAKDKGPEGEMTRDRQRDERDEGSRGEKEAEGCGKKDAEAKKTNSLDDTERQGGSQARRGFGLEA